MHVGTCTTDRFEGPTEAKGPVLIFPLFFSEGGQLRAGHGSVTEGRLGPPESARTVRTSFWDLGVPETRIPRSERKRRLLHNFLDEKMTSECTIFPYGNNHAFLRKSMLTGIKIRRPHSSLLTKAVKSCLFSRKAIF